MLFWLPWLCSMSWGQILCLQLCSFCLRLFWLFGVISGCIWILEFLNFCRMIAFWWELHEDCTSLCIVWILWQY
jgi:hypothetical protein